MAINIIYYVMGSSINLYLVIISFLIIFNIYNILSFFINDKERVLA